MNVFADEFDLAASLATDTDGSVLRTVRDGLQEGLQHTRRLIDKGLAPEDFKTAQALKQGFETALEVVETGWNSKHKH